LAGDDGDIAAFVDNAQRVDGEDLAFYQTSTALRAKAQRVVRPYAGALTAFALAGAIAIALVIGQALARQVFLASVDSPVLAAVGMSGGQLLAGLLGRVALAAIGGAAVAATVAILLSPLAPIGPARFAEPDPGMASDWFVLGVGAAATLILPVLIALGPAWFAARAAVRRSADDGGRKPSAVVDSLVRAGAPVVASTGIRMALERGGGRNALPVRTTLIGAALSVGVLATAIVFGNSLDHLVSSPHLYGGNWDATYDGGPQMSRTHGKALVVQANTLAADDAVEGVSIGGQAQVLVDGEPVPAIGVQTLEGDVHPTIVEGRMIAGDEEVVLGSNTLRRLGKSVGDQVLIGAEGPPTAFRVVGRAVFPLFAAYPSADKTGLGDGAAVTLDALKVIATGAYESLVLVDLGGDRDVFNRLQSDIGPGFEAPDRPEDIVGYEKVSVVPYVLTGLLVVLVGGTAAHALVVGVHRRRRDLAILKTVGFERRQVTGVVAWQATALAIVGIGVGLPVGVLVGSWIWRWFADRIGAVPEPAVSVVALVAVGVIALVAANAIAFLPARRAARMSPAAVLRAE
jgi:ABC-type lipoprotein release transport system permease subunit